MLGPAASVAQLVAQGSMACFSPRELRRPYSRALCWPDIEQLSTTSRYLSMSLAVLFVAQPSAALTARPLRPSLRPAQAGEKHRPAMHDGRRASLADVDRLRSLVLPRASAASKTRDQLEQISTLVDTLSATGGDQYLADGSLYGNYEVAFFDRSVDGDRSNQTNTQKSRDYAARQSSGYANATRRPFGLRSKLLGSLFSLRYSFQHIVEPNTVVNFVGFRFLCFPASVTARGSFTPLNDTALAAIKEKHGTALRPGTSVRIDFDVPRLSAGPLAFDLGGSAAQPPVDICFTFVDASVRLGLAARGGKFVFTRGGLADEPYADDWEALLARPPTSGRAVATAAAALGALLAAVLPAARRPLAYAALATGALAAVKSADGKRRGRRGHRGGDAGRKA